MFCNDCETDRDLHVVGVHDLSGDDPFSIVWVFCTECLKGKELWCEYHGQTQLFYDPDVAQHPESMSVLSVCVGCCRDEVLSADFKTVSEQAALVRQALPEATVDALAELPYILESHDPDVRLIFNLTVLAALYDRTFSESLSDLISEAYNIDRYN